MSLHTLRTNKYCSSAAMKTGSQFFVKSSLLGAGDWVRCPDGLDFGEYCEMKCNVGYYLSKGAAHSAVCNEEVYTAGSQALAFQKGLEKQYDGTRSRPAISWSSVDAVPECSPSPKGCAKIVTANTNLIYSAEPNASEEKRKNAARAGNNFYGVGTTVTATCADGTISSGPTAADGSAILTCGSALSVEAVDADRRSGLDPTLRGNFDKPAWTPAPPAGGFACTIATCPNLAMPAGMISQFTEGTYGLRTQNSIASLQCPQAGYAPQPSPHTFTCSDGKWQTVAAYAFNGMSYAANHEFTGPWAGSFVNINLQTMKGIWWNPAYANGQQPGRSFLGRERAGLSHARTPPKSVGCVVGTGGKFGKREDHDHVMVDGEIK